MAVEELSVFHPASAYFTFRLPVWISDQAWQKCRVCSVCVMRWVLSYVYIYIYIFYIFYLSLSYYISISLYHYISLYLLCVSRQGGLKNIAFNERICPYKTNIISHSPVKWFHWVEERARSLWCFKQQKNIIIRFQRANHTLTRFRQLWNFTSWVKCPSWFADNMYDCWSPYGFFFEWFSNTRKYWLD